MQQIAAENNLAETAFYIRSGSGFADPLVHARRARWTSADTRRWPPAYVVFTYDACTGDVRRVRVEERRCCGSARDGDLLVLDFPADTRRPPRPTECSWSRSGASQPSAYKGKTDYLLVYGGEDDVTALAPDFADLAMVPARGIIVTAPGRDVDFVSRFFAPAGGRATRTRSPARRTRR